MKSKQHILLVIAMLVSGLAAAQVFERSREVTKSYRVYEPTSLEIVNKYGNINLFNWSKDSVKIEIRAEVKASKQQKADKLFDFIDFEFTDSRYFIVARTQFRQNQGSFWAELSDLASTVFSGNNKIQVDYNVYLPTEMEVRLENKFGNIYCTNHRGKMTIDLSNGDFKAYDLAGETDIALSFGKASINSIESGTVELGYAELTLASASRLEVESKSSEISITTADIVSLQSRRDQVSVETINILEGETSFSYITLGFIERDIKLSTDYGELKVMNIPSSYDKIVVNARFTDVQLIFPENIHTNIDIEHSETTGIYYPDRYTGLAFETVDKKTDRYRTAGIIGRTEQASGLTEISIQSGKVSLQESISGLR